MSNVTAYINCSRIIKVGAGASRQPRISIYIFSAKLFLCISIVVRIGVVVIVHRVKRTARRP